LDELIKESLRNYNSISQITTIQLLAALLLNFLLTLILAKFYTITHNGYSYSKSFVHSIVYIGITITLIMVIIGSNIARAFALVGAMSIIRFRNPVKDSRDLVFIFMSMAIGMACGTHFYLFSIIFTIFVVAIALFFQISEFGEINHRSYIFKITLKNGKKEEILKIFEKFCMRTSIVSIDRHSENNTIEDVIYEVDLKKKSTYETLLSSLSSFENILSVTLLVGENNINV